jgi:hypothetical protein
MLSTHELAKGDVLLDSGGLDPRLLWTVGNGAVSNDLGQRSVIVLVVSELTFPETQLISPRIAARRELFSQPMGSTMAVKLSFLIDMLISWMKALGFSALSLGAGASSFLAHSKDPFEIRTESVLTGWTSEETGAASEATRKL